MKALCPPSLVRNIMESELTIQLINGSELSVVGMDVPQRVEGRPLDFIDLDEYADMKEETWQENVRPALSTLGRPGEAWFTGVPAGRNHFYKLSTLSLDPKNEEWGTYHWKSDEILDPKEIAQAKMDMDPMQYAQEYEASFLNFEGRAYHPFDRAIHVSKGILPYDKERPLIVCLDFNVTPGVAAIAQEHDIPGYGSITCFIGEVWIPSNSNTQLVCRRIVSDWGTHTGEVYMYGDATGGARGSAKVSGSDWDIVRDELKPHFNERLKFRIQKSNPAERVRINAVNARLMTADNKIHTLVSPICVHIIEDFEGVVLVEGGSGEIDKFIDKYKTHISDALGYYIVQKFPLVREHLTLGSIF